MKKNISKLIVTILILLISTSYCYGAENEDFVRVRVRAPRQHNEQAELSGYESITLYDNSSNTPIELFKTENEISVLMDSYFDKSFNFLTDSNNAAIGPYHVRIKDKKYGTYDEVNNEISEIVKRAGKGFYPYYNGKNYEIYIGSFLNEGSAANIFSKLTQNGLNGEIIGSNKKNVVIYNKSNEIIFMYSNNNNIYFSSYNSSLQSNIIKIDDRPYRGMISFNIINDSTLISINRVDVESYLYGVVPCESSASWPIEALKAQTLTARTYALSRLKPNAYYGYDLEDNNVDQVYGGFKSEYPSTNKAVDETRGQKIYYDNKLIEAFFHSTSGGSTENSENVWSEARPYLIGVQDEYSNISPITQWEEKYSKDYIIDRLNLYGNNVSELLGIEITRVSENNRVLECIFLTDKGKITYTKDKIRSVLGLKSLWFSIKNNINSFTFIFGNESNNVPSRGSIIDSIIDDDKSDKDKGVTNDVLNQKYMISSTGKTVIKQDNVAVISASSVTIRNNKISDSNEYLFSGRGWGHGIGLSQYGAKEMASKGFTYEEIIKHYYTGVNIK